MKLRPRAPILLALFLCSGAAGLGDQMVWVRMLAAGLGHEVPALVGVTAAFLGGMALGAWVLGGRLGRSSPPDAARWYGALELLIGVWAAGSAFFIPFLNDAALQLTGPAPSALRQSLVVFALPLLALLPATSAMGATLPAMERFLAPSAGGGRCVAGLYSANTFGAVLGIAGTVFALLPSLGFRRSLLVLAALHVACGMIAILLRAGTADGAAPKAVERSRRGRSAKPTAPVPEGLLGRSGSTARVRITLFLTGLLGMGFQLVGLRILSQVLENTLYTYAAVLTVYLIGTALGAAGYQRWGARCTASGALSALLGGAAVSSLLAAHATRLLHPIYIGLRDGFGDSLLAVACAEMSVSACVFLLPTLFTGAIFGHLTEAVVGRQAGLGRAVSVNTLGCALAAGLVGLWLLPALGTKWTMTAMALGYLFLLPEVRRTAGAASTLALGLVVLLPAELRQVDLPPGARVQEYREGIMASVAVVRTADDQRSLRVNNRLQMGGTAATLAERRQAHLPLLLHPGPKRALFLGPGTGITLGAATHHPGLTIDGVELVPEVLEVMSDFEPENEGVRSRPGVRLHAADARRFVRTTTNRYDVIVADLFHPAQDGAGFLYTREHYEAVRRCLEPGGLFCQWLPLHQLDDAGVRSIVRAFLESFPRTHAFLLHFNVDIPALGLMGAAGTWHFSGDWLDRRLASQELQAALRGVGLEKPIQVLGCLAADPAGLGRYAQAGEISTDDYPAILFGAPRHTVRRDAQPHDVLLSFLAETRVDGRRFAAETLEGENGAFGGHLADFIAARELYLQGLVQEGAGQLAEAIERYLESTRRSVYFTASYARCVTIIQLLAATDRPRARELLQRLEDAQPAQPLTKTLRQLVN